MTVVHMLHIERLQNILNWSADRKHNITPFADKLYGDPCNAEVRSSKPSPGILLLQTPTIGAVSLSVAEA